MARSRPEPPPEEIAGPPAWMITFSDCMNLLLTFFVLLVTFSSFSDQRHSTILAVGAAIRTAFGQMPEQTTKTGGGQDKSSMAVQHQIQLAAQPEYGSDKPTGKPVSPDNSGVLQNDVQTADYHDHKLFLISSRQLFLGKGVVLSAEGRYLLAVMAAFLKEVPGRVVLSENGPDRQDADLELGLARAWTALEFLVKAQGLDPQRFGISGLSLASDPWLVTDDTSQEPQEGPPTRRTAGGNPDTGRERRLEIVVLDGRVAR